MRLSCNKNSADIDLMSSGADPVPHLPINAPWLSPICKTLWRVIQNVPETLSPRRVYFSRNCSSIWFWSTHLLQKNLNMLNRFFQDHLSLITIRWSPAQLTDRHLCLGSKCRRWAFDETIHIPPTNMIETFIHILNLPPRWWKNPYISHQRDGNTHPYLRPRW